MNWLNPEDEINMKEAILDDNDRQTWSLMEELIQAYDVSQPGSGMGDFSTDTPYSTSNLANALLLCSSHFKESEDFFTSLSWSQKVLASEQFHRVLQSQREIAEAETHQGEADE